jgi:hypothetical protein
VSTTEPMRIVQVIPEKGILEHSFALEYGESSSVAAAMELSRALPDGFPGPRWPGAMRDAYGVARWQLGRDEGCRATGGRFQFREVVAFID